MTADREEERGRERKRGREDDGHKKVQKETENDEGERIIGRREAGIRSILEKLFQLLGLLLFNKYFFFCVFICIFICISICSIYLPIYLFQILPCIYPSGKDKNYLGTYIYNDSIRKHAAPKWMNKNTQKEKAPSLQAKSGERGSIRLKHAHKGGGRKQKESIGGWRIPFFFFLFLSWLFFFAIEKRKKKKVYKASPAESPEPNQALGKILERGSIPPIFC